LGRCKGKNYFKSKKCCIILSFLKKRKKLFIMQLNGMNSKEMGWEKNFLLPLTMLFYLFNLTHYYMGFGKKISGGIVSGDFLT